MTDWICGEMDIIGENRYRVKAKHTILLIALGFCLDFAGGLLKTAHSSHAYGVLVAATLIKATGVLLFAYKVIRYEGFRKFMER